MSIHEDLMLAKETQKNVKKLESKYKWYRLNEIVDVLDISGKHKISIDEISRGYYSYKLKKTKAYITFNICHGYSLANSKTHFKQDEDKWYIHLSFGGCGRKNFFSGQQYEKILYGEKGEEVWDAFLNTIISYAPLDYDKLNNEFLFGMEKGYKLYGDFEKIFKETNTEFEKLIKNEKIKQLKEELELLKGGDGNA